MASEFTDNQRKKIRDIVSGKRYASLIISKGSKPDPTMEGDAMLLRINKPREHMRYYNLWKSKDPKGSKVVYGIDQNTYDDFETFLSSARNLT